MSLEQRINTDLKTAMLAKDEAGLRALRAVKSAILLAKTEKTGSEDLAPETELKLLQKLVKQRRESLEIYQQQGREDLAKVEREELEIIRKYLPQQMSQEELEARLRSIIEATGATSMKDMGKVIGTANKELAGKAEGKVIAETVKRLLV
mgnify:CR=1 FL=1